MSVHVGAVLVQQKNLILLMPINGYNCIKKLGKTMAERAPQIWVLAESECLGRKQTTQKIIQTGSTK